MKTYDQRGKNPVYQGERGGEAMEPVKRPKGRRYLPLAGTAVAVFSHVEIRLLDVEHLEEDYRELRVPHPWCSTWKMGKSLRSD